MRHVTAQGSPGDARLRPGRQLGGRQEQRLHQEVSLVSGEGLGSDQSHVASGSPSPTAASTAATRPASTGSTGAASGAAAGWPRTPPSVGNTQRLDVLEAASESCFICICICLKRLSTSGRLAIIRCMAGRRVDSLEQRVAQQDSANRGILEQLMKVQQDFKVNICR